MFDPEQRYSQSVMFNQIPEFTRPIARGLLKILDFSYLKAYADGKINVTQAIRFVVYRIENIVEIGENAGYQHFLLFPQCFHKLSIPETYKPGIVSERVYSGWITFQSPGKELDLYTNCTIWSYSVEKHQYVIGY